MSMRAHERVDVDPAHEPVDVEARHHAVDVDARDDPVDVHPGEDPVDVERVHDDGRDALDRALRRGDERAAGVAAHPAAVVRERPQRLAGGVRGRAHARDLGREPDGPHAHADTPNAATRSPTRATPAAAPSAASPGEHDRMPRGAVRTLAVGDHLPAELAPAVPLVGHCGGIYPSRRRRTPSRKRACSRASPESSGWKLIASTVPSRGGDRVAVDRGEHLDARRRARRSAARG